MKRSLLLSLALLALLFNACKDDPEKVAALRAVDSLQSIVDNKDAEIDALFDVLNDIENNLNEIASKYSQVRTLQQANPEASTRVKGQINDQLGAIEAIMEQNKEKIAALNAKVAALGKENTQLQEFIESLNARIADQESQIASLVAELNASKSTIRRLSDNVTELTASNQQKDEYIAYQAAEANKAYYIVGTYKELRNLGIVDKSGGFIGIGKKQNTTTSMDVSHFQLIDRSKVRTVTINQRKAKVVSKHPAGSYELVYDEHNSKLAAYLNILDVNAFWQYTDYLVISTDK